MKLEPGKFCPLIKKDCMGLQCSWFTQVRGTNPQSGTEVDNWACAIVWMPMLLINTAQEVRQGAAATEDFRNQMVHASEKALRMHVAIAGMQDALKPITLNQDGK
ncbi:hypothetical protein CSQ91_12800 [Janthinobacterium sp. BJB301]|uniref:hypothetical protein n=1 Tax=Janthinobacterium sp. BJB301 TaxID=1560195 RepID=UPI000C0EF3B3|nr:hypothetical protein [Janthinobacterium sp. BJB301]PHV51889.1 hypothetical protein CSQ91_12800 [Janthinobacterium sp. BJB301]